MSFATSANLNASSALVTASVVVANRDTIQRSSTVS